MRPNLDERRLTRPTTVVGGAALQIIFGLHMEQFL